jgi:hypothetical protein
MKSIIPKQISTIQVIHANATANVRSSSNRKPGIKSSIIEKFILNLN